MKLVKKLGYNFIDTDSLIEKREKDSIKNIYTKGRTVF